MKKLKFNSVQFETEELKKTAMLLIASGFRLYTSINKHNRLTSYIYYEENQKIAYLQSNSYGVAYSTVHKPVGHGMGSGFGLCEYTRINLTIDELRTAFTRIPRWIGERNISKITKYKGMGEYVENNTILTYAEIV